MAFHDIKLPEKVSYGATFGPAFNVAILRAASGHEQRVSRWSAPLRTMNLSSNMRELSQLYTTYEFFLAREGETHGFRVKDWLDFSSNPLRRADNDVAETDQDQVIGTGDGDATVFQLKKTYELGDYQVERLIEKPVEGTVLISVDDVSQTSGWSVNYDTGEITFTVAPGLALPIKAGFEFDVPGRFDIGPEAFQIAIDHFSSGSIPDLTIAELRSGLSLDERRNPGGSYDHGVVTANTAVRTDALTQRFEVNASGLKLTLPLESSLPTGGEWFVLQNTGTESVDVRTNGDTQVVALPSGTVVILWLSKTILGTNTWVPLG